MNNEFLWVEKYRPKKIADCILTDDLKSTFQQFVNAGNIPNMLLSGGPGIGKTTVAKAMLEELGCDYIVINGSMNGNIDTLRTEIRNFASTVSFSGGRKYVILDEADYLNPSSTQPALRNFMEEYSSNCGFILTCNFKNRVIEPLQSRCTTIDFKDVGTKQAALFLKRMVDILNNENVTFDQKVLVKIVQKYMPDWRRIINELQRYSVSGNIDSGIFIDLDDTKFKVLMSALKDKKFADVRKWVGENSDTDANELYAKIYDALSDNLVENTIPSVILTLAKYQYQSAFVASQEINTMACMIEIMVDGEWK